MSLFAFAVAAQLAAALQPSPSVLAFPEPGLDDSAAYAGYTTRFFRDAERNTLQIYLDRREGRVVHLFANGENESIGFSVRDPRGAAADLQWESDGAQVAKTGRRKSLSYDVRSSAAALHLGRFVLGSMRIERDVQYFKEHAKPFSDAPYALPEFEQLLQQVAAQSPAVQRQALALLRASSVDALRRRFSPSLVAPRAGAAVTAVIEQLSLDALDTMRVTITPLSGTALAAARSEEVILRTTAGAPLHFRVTVSTTGRALSPLTRQEIFTEDFLAWAGDMQRRGDATRSRWIERQITGVELLASREKLMAGLPTYATYFGRDMLVSALMMQPIWRPEMSEFVIAAALRKLSSGGEVSHEEALGGQAIREAAAEATALLRAADTPVRRVPMSCVRRRCSVCRTDG